MKLLLCLASLKDADEFLKEYQIQIQNHSSRSFVSSAKFNQHEVDIVETGVGLFQTSYKITKTLSSQKYHLALKAGFGNSYKEEIAVGSVLNVVNEKPGDFGTFINGSWKDYYDFGLLNKDDEPHIRGSYINLTSAYMNIFSAFKKAVSVTVNHYSDRNNYPLRAEKYKADCETCDGLGFVYPCLFEKQSFYHLCVVEKNLLTGEENFHLAKQKLNETVISLLQKL